jgi:hypothetical protein
MASPATFLQSCVGAAAVSRPRGGINRHCNCWRVPLFPEPAAGRGYVARLQAPGIMSPCPTCLDSTCSVVHDYEVTCQGAFTTAHVYVTVADPAGSGLELVTAWQVQ